MIDPMCLEKNFHVNLNHPYDMRQRTAAEPTIMAVLASSAISSTQATLGADYSQQPIQQGDLNCPLAG
jgi:hypothetical protein